MKDKRGTDGCLIDISSQEFKDYLRGLDPGIDPNKFLLMARMIAGNKFEELPDNASDTIKKARARNIDTEVAVTLEHEPEYLIMRYHALMAANPVTCEEIHHDHYLERERDFAIREGLDPIEKLAEIDRPDHAGMTRLGNIIIRSDNVNEVRNLIEIEGASPVAKSGEYTPLELAEELGRVNILEYLRGIC